MQTILPLEALCMIELKMERTSGTLFFDVLSACCDTYWDKCVADQCV